MDFSLYLRVFLIGGAFCIIAQILLDKTNLTPARILVGYVIAGVFLGAVGVYDTIIELGGAGATTPLSGFGHLIAEGTKKEIDERGFIGIFSGPLTSAAVGTSAALIFGFVASLIFKSKSK
jgi:stage V sporulation protein AE